jgi:hypothetical protein
MFASSDDDNPSVFEYHLLVHSTRASIAHDACDVIRRQRHSLQSVDAVARRTAELRREQACAYDIQAARVPIDNMCVRPADLIANYQIRRGYEWTCDPGADDCHDGFPTWRHHRRQRGISRSSRMQPRGAAPTSPPEGVLRHMRHQQPVQAVGTH